MRKDEGGKWTGFRLDEPLVGELHELEKDEVLQAVLEHLELKILRDKTPDYTEVMLVKKND